MIEANYVLNCTLNNPSKARLIRSRFVNKQLLFYRCWSLASSLQLIGLLLANILKSLAASTLFKSQAVTTQQLTFLTRAAFLLSSPGHRATAEKDRPHGHPPSPAGYEDWPRKIPAGLLSQTTGWCACLRAHQQVSPLYGTWHHYETLTIQCGACSASASVLAEQPSKACINVCVCDDDESKSSVIRWSNRTCSTQRRVDRHRQQNEHLVLDNDLKEVRLQVLLPIQPLSSFLFFFSSCSVCSLWLPQTFFMSFYFISFWLTLPQGLICQMVDRADEK